MQYLRWDILPVPWVLLRCAFFAHLYDLILASGYPHDAHFPFWMWYARLPQRLQIVWLLLCLGPKDGVPAPI